MIAGLCIEISKIKYSLGYLCFIFFIRVNKMFNHQDWNPVILKKKECVVKETIIKTDKQNQVSSTTNKPLWKIEKQVDSDAGKPIDYVSRDDAQKIISGRIAMKLTQKDLATRLNMQLKDIQDIESCKSIENKLTLSKIKKFLQIKC